MAPLDLSKQLKNYENKWVALSDDSTRVLGAGDSAKEALQDAKNNGYNEATLMYVQPTNLLYCGAHI